MITEDLLFVDGTQDGRVLGRGDPTSWRRDGAWAWIGLERPDAAELEQVEAATGLDVEVLERVWRHPIRPSAAAAGDAGILGYRLARYDVETSSVEITDAVVAIGPDFMVARSDETQAIRDFGAALAGDPAIATRGPTAFFAAGMELVLDMYLDVIELLDVDIKQVERATFTAGRGNPVEQIYRLRRAVSDLEELVTRLNEESAARFVERRMPAWMSQHPRWPEDKAALGDTDRQLDRMVNRVQAQRGLLDSILNANLVQVGIQQNVDMRKISAWAALAAIPTVVGGIYGMNFEHMPELSWQFGYPLALGVMATACGLLYWQLRRNDWL